MIRLLLLTCFLSCLFAQEEDNERRGPKGPQERWEIVLNWLKAKVPSIYVDKRVVMRPGRFGDQVLSAADHIKEGEFLLQLPVKTFLWEEDCFPSEVVAQLETGYVSTLKTFPKWKIATTDAPDYTQAAICLLIHRLLGNQSDYEPYLSQLPRQSEVFMFHAPDEFEVLRGTNAFRTLKGMQSKHNAILDDGPGEIFPMVRSYLPHLMNLSDALLRNELEQALALCGSRTFYMDSEMLAPGKVLPSKKVFRPVLVPLIDFVNHGDMRTRNCQYYFNRTHQHFQLQTIRNIEPGEELVMSYGLRANWELLIFYGFSMEGNLEDFVSVNDLAHHALEFNFRLRLLQIEKERAVLEQEKEQDEEMVGEKNKSTVNITSNTTTANTTANNTRISNAANTTTNITAVNDTTTTHAANSTGKHTLTNTAAHVATVLHTNTSLRCYSPYFHPSAGWPPFYQVTIQNASPKQNSTPLSLGPLSPSVYYALYTYLQPPHSPSVRNSFLALAEDSKIINLHVLGGEVNVKYKNGSEVHDYANESLSSHGDLVVTLHWQSPSLPLACKHKSSSSPFSASPFVSASSSSSSSSALCKDVTEKNEGKKDSVATKKCIARDEEEDLRTDFRLRRHIIRAAKLDANPDKIFREGLLPQSLAAIKIAALPSLSAFEVHRILGGGKQLSADMGISRTLTVFCFEEISRRLQVLGVETEESLKLLLAQARSNVPVLRGAYGQLARSELEILTHFCTLIGDWDHPLWE